jgi:hypothetical protein
MTKKYKTLATIFTILSFVLTCGPLGYYFITGFMVADVSHKFILSMSLIMCLFLTIISLIAKFHLRSPLFIILLGLYFVLNNIATLLVFLAVATILDELLFTPLARHYRNKARINREIDKRIGE